MPGGVSEIARRAETPQSTISRWRSVIWSAMVVGSMSNAPVMLPWWRATCGRMSTSSAPAP
jgi:hypothetical protein